MGVDTWAVLQASALQPLLLVLLSAATWQKTNIDFGDMLAPAQAAYISNVWDIT